MFYLTVNIPFEKQRDKLFFIFSKEACQQIPPMLQSAACNFIKKETLTQVFSCEFCEISKNTFFTEHLRKTASIQFIPFFLITLESLRHLFSDKLQIKPVLTHKSRKYVTYEDTWDMEAR